MPDFTDLLKDLHSISQLIPIRDGTNIPPYVAEIQKKIKGVESKILAKMLAIVEVQNVACVKFCLFF
jgi:hypothetical protein